MKIQNIVLQYEDYESEEELKAEDRGLLQAAVKSTMAAYAPYSHFKVGAAVRLKNGSIFTGNNQENIAYPSGLCAERVALFYAQSQNPDIAVDAIAVSARSSDFEIDQPVTPCGSCRQVIAEYENLHKNPIRIIMGGHEGQVRVVNGIENLLPMLFYLEELKK
jgi:cytidine deaminase